MKMNRKNAGLMLSAILAAVLLVLPSAAQDQRPQTGQDPATAQSGQQKDLVEAAASAGNFTTLTRALDTAGLTETLKSGDYTIFAPTDEAFAKLPAGTLDALMKDPERLRKVLLYHVVPGKLTSGDVAKMKSAKTAEGTSLKIKSADGKVMVDKATVTGADITASNGVIHPVDSVLIPTPMSAARQ